MTSKIETLPPIAERLFRERPSLMLLGGRHRETGGYTFPMPEGVGSEHYETCELGSRGTLFTWTVQRFRPKSPPYAGPEEFEPFALGYVNVEGRVIVEARLTNVDPTEIHCGMPMRLVLQPFARAGTSVTIFAFEPEIDQ